LQVLPEYLRKWPGKYLDFWKGLGGVPDRSWQVGTQVVPGFWVSDAQHCQSGGNSFKPLERKLVNSISMESKSVILAKMGGKLVNCRNIKDRTTIYLCIHTIGLEVGEIRSCKIHLRLY
jgi:hypothetical protein